MEQTIIKEKEPFYKVRSIGACWSKGVSLFSDNVKSIFKFSWIYMLFGAVICLALQYAYVNSNLDNMQKISEFNPKVATCIILAFIADTYGLSIFFSLIKFHASSYNLGELKYSFFRKEVRKWLLPSLYLIILCLVFIALFSVLGVCMILFSVTHLEQYGWMLYVGIVLLAFYILFVLPSFYVVCMSVVLSGKKFFPAVWAGIVLSFKYYGKVFATALLTLLTVGVLLFFMYLPVIGTSYIISYCNTATMMGDYTPLPPGFEIWGSLLSVVSVAIICLLFFMIYSISAYLYSSIKINYEEKLANTGEY